MHQGPPNLSNVLLFVPSPTAVEGPKSCSLGPKWDVKPLTAGTSPWLPVPRGWGTENAGDCTSLGWGKGPLNV